MWTDGLHCLGPRGAESQLPGRLYTAKGGGNLSRTLSEASCALERFNTISQDCSWSKYELDN